MAMDPKLEEIKSQIIKWLNDEEFLEVADARIVDALLEAVYRIDKSYLYSRMGKLYRATNVPRFPEQERR